MTKASKYGLDVDSPSVDSKLSNQENYQKIAQELAQINLFQEIVEQYFAKLLTDNVGNFVSMLLSGSSFSSIFSGGGNSEFKNSFATGISNAINDPSNIAVKTALADYLNAYFGLTPTTPIEPIE